MEILIGLGVILSVIGIIGIILSIVKVQRAKRDIPDDAELRARIQAVMPLNIGAFFLSMLGLMCVMMGVILS